MTTSQSFRAGGALFGIVWAAVVACSSDEAKAPVGLAKPCSLNSDCTSPLVCAFRLCHSECEQDRDCDGEQRCVIGADGNICQLEDEIHCSSDRDCPGSQRCGDDGECRDICRDADDCTEGQLCAVSGECASTDPMKDSVDTDGNIQKDPFGTGGTPGEGGQGGESSGGTGGKGGAAGKGGNGGSGGSSGSGSGPVSTEDCPAPTGSPVPHPSETLTEADTWSGEHLITSYLQVQAALDIAPCAIITLDAGAYIEVEEGGTLRAIGTPGMAVTFTSSKASPAAGDWESIAIYDSASNDSRLEHVIVEYGGDTSTVRIQSSASASLSNVLVRNSEADAISLSLGVSVSEFENVAVEDAGGYPLSVNANEVGQVGTITSTASASDEILVIAGNQLTTAATWQNHGIPYRVIGGSYSDLDILARLELEAGVTLKMEAGIEVATNGALVTAGTETDLVTFTSGKSSPAAGDWPRIVIDADSSSDSLLEYTVIEYAGENSYPAIDVVGGGTIGLNHVIIRDVGGVGVDLSQNARASRFENVSVERAGDSAYYVCTNQLGSLTSLTATESVRNEVKVWQEPVTMAATWRNHGIPYRLVYGNGSIGYLRAPVTLEAGVVLQLDSAQNIVIDTNGSLTAEGTEDQPVEIRSGLAVATPGSWGSITVSAAASGDSILTYTNISDGSSGTLSVDGSRITLDNVTFANCDTCDVDIGNGMLVETSGSTNSFIPCP